MGVLEAKGLMLDLFGVWAGNDPEQNKKLFEWFAPWLRGLEIQIFIGHGKSCGGSTAGRSPDHPSGGMRREGRCHMTRALNSNTSDVQCSS